MFHYIKKTPNYFSLPLRIKRLGELAYNLWWSWNPNAQRLFSRIDDNLWNRVGHNPVVFLREVKRSQLNAVANNRYFLEFYDRIFSEYDRYMKPKATWFKENYAKRDKDLIAYFSMEYGLHQILPIYAGGLGVLSGDHTKEASDLGLPLVAVGLFYSEGYFSQKITEDGWQEARYHTHELANLPIMQVVDENGTPISISVELPGRELKANIWEIHVGRISVFLLDTNMPENTPEDRRITARLYSSDPDFRISQEILLGIGGVRALRSLGYNPAVWHMNEGHSAFMGIERIRELTSKGTSFKEAFETVKANTLFTTHTPVPAGSDEFPLWLIEKYMSAVWNDIGLTRDQFIDLARHQLSWGEAFSMPILAFKTSQLHNAVSELHEQISRNMWNFLWKKKKVEEVPISHVTNGIHTGTWLARRMRNLFDHYLGADWLEHLDKAEVVDQITNIPDDRLWVVRRHLKRKLVWYMREFTRQQWLNGDILPIQVITSGLMLNPYSLTIGFARRFAPYKRANLILRDLDRLLGLINQPGMPVQIIFAGKSHPDHEGGKLLIQEVYQAVKSSDNAGRLVFLEDYDMNLANYLVQGVDVWMNTPRRPNEASGTSGQKSAINGVLNLSILDGWWREGYNGKNGWAIGLDQNYENDELQDESDAESLLDILENEVIPLYYRLRSSDRLPGEWIAMMKESIRTLLPHFSTRRMVKEYTQNYYIPLVGD